MVPGMFIWLVCAVVGLDISKCAFKKPGSGSDSDQMAAAAIRSSGLEVLLARGRV
jgi:hypothetical protein